MSTPVAWHAPTDSPRGSGVGGDGARRRRSRPAGWGERGSEPPLGRITGDLLTSRGGSSGEPPPAGCGTYPPARRRRATSRLSFCARPNRRSSARTPHSSLRPPSYGASSSAWRSGGVSAGGVSATGVAAAAVRRRGGAPSRGLRRRGGGPEDLVDFVQRLDLRLQALDLTLAVGDCLCYDSHWVFPGAVIGHVVRRAHG